MKMQIAQFFGGTVSQVMKVLEKCSKILFKWFDDNLMKANNDKSHLHLSTKVVLVTDTNGGIISTTKIKKILGFTIDYQLDLIHQWRRSAVFIVKFEHISHFF